MRVLNDFCQAHIRNVAQHIFGGHQLPYDEAEDDQFVSFADLKWGGFIQRVEGIMATTLFSFTGTSLVQVSSPFVLIPYKDRFDQFLPDEELKLPDPKPEYPAYLPTRFAVQDDNYASEEVLTIIMKTLYPLFLWYTYYANHKKAITLDRLRPLISLMNLKTNDGDVVGLLKSFSNDGKFFSDHTISHVIEELKAPGGELSGTDKFPVRRHKYGYDGYGDDEPAPNKYARTEYGPASTSTDNTPAKEQIIDGVKEVQNYISRIEQYGSCVRFALDETFLKYGLSTTVHSLIRISGNRIAHRFKPYEEGFFDNVYKGIQTYMDRFKGDLEDPADCPSTEELLSTIKVFKHVNDGDTVNVTERVRDWVTRYHPPSEFLVKYFPHFYDSQQ